MIEIKLKHCKVCGQDKEEAFAPNQYGKDNRVLRRPVCRECYAKKVRADPVLKKLFEEKHPRPKIGEEFFCPICEKRFIREHKNDIVIDRSHINGSIRGWLCSSCNTSLGKFNDDIGILQKAINWIKNKGLKLFSFC